MTTRQVREPQGCEMKRPAQYVKSMRQPREQCKAMPLTDSEQEWCWNWEKTRVEAIHAHVSRALVYLSPRRLVVVVASWPRPPVPPAITLNH
jgi:hypothetical protein